MVKVEPSIIGGMGAVLADEGVSFRVWAPNADSVSVIGSFNNWNNEENFLYHEENGYWSAIVKNAKAGDEYKFCIKNGANEFHRIDPYAREVTNSVGNSVITKNDFDWGDNNFQMPSWNELVIYEMHVGTFNAKDDGAPGDFYRVVDKLPYLKNLGINAIEIMPPMEFPGSFSWGYNPSHPFALESDYGGTTAFKELIKAAHQNGIAVIIDVVFNHLGPSDLDLWQFDGWSENGSGGIYFYNDWKSETPWGNTRPDYGRPEVRQYLRDNALMWLEEYHVDGLRWDGVDRIRNVNGLSNSPASDLPEGWEMIQWIHNEINERFPWKISIAEDLKSNEWITKSTEEGGAGFNAQWDPHFVHPVRDVIIPNDDQFRDMNLLKDAILYKENEDVFKRIIYTESHDEVANGKARVPEEIWPGNVASWFAKKRSNLGAGFVFTSPGIPMIFQGQELLEDRWFHDKDPIDWQREKEFKGLVDLYRRLIFLRRNIDGKTAGLLGQNAEVFHLNDERKVIAFHRWDKGGPGDSVIIAANLTTKPVSDYRIGFPNAGLWKVRFNSDSNTYDLEFQNHFTPDTEAENIEMDGYSTSGNISLGAYSMVIYSQD